MKWRDADSTWYNIMSDEHVCDTASAVLKILNVLWPAKRGTSTEPLSASLVLPVTTTGLATDCSLRVAASVAVNRPAKKAGKL